MSDYKFKIGDVVVRTHDPEDFRYGDKPMMIIGFDWDYDLILEGEETDGVGWCADYFELYNEETQTRKQLEYMIYKAINVFGKDKTYKIITETINWY